ncbi:UNVERIFIED_CONTAM: hypothetical protein Slati_0510400 [Sesamum latifolium]|uniref:Uncharacterized protein n=1 Tax=Sesamum latifolium TaxID=2727402 RepID=A0AAW2XXE3_9LAMI
MITVNLETLPECPPTGKKCIKTGGCCLCTSEQEDAYHEFFGCTFTFARLVWAFSKLPWEAVSCYRRGRCAKLQRDAFGTP